MFSAGTKRLLKNFILHTGTHNRIVEENEMWRQHAKNNESNFGESKKNSFLDDKRDDMSDARYNMKRCSAHMDESNDKTSTYWARQLQKSEEADPERWGHSGYKELYPKDFDSDRSLHNSSSSSSSSSADRRKRKKRRKKLKEMEEKQRKRKKKAKKHKKRHLSDSESDSEKGKKVKKKKHRKHKIDSDSDSEDNVPRKRLKQLGSEKKSKNSSQRKKRSKHKHKKHGDSSD